LGNRRVLSGQKRVPTPPAKIVTESSMWPPMHCPPRVLRGTE
jgi:hypothetical protein